MGNKKEPQHSNRLSAVNVYPNHALTVRRQRESWRERKVSNVMKRYLIQHETKQEIIKLSNGPRSRLVKLVVELRPLLWFRILVGMNTIDRR